VRGAVHGRGVGVGWPGSAVRTCVSGRDAYVAQE
jgi:hypothetical protein